jgi:hypothetical protein
MAQELSEGWRSELIRMLNEYILLSSESKAVEYAEVNVLMGVCRHNSLSSLSSHIVKAMVLKKMLGLPSHREKELICSGLISIYHMFSSFPEHKITSQTLNTAYDMFLELLSMRDSWGLSTVCNRSMILSHFVDVYTRTQDQSRLVTPHEDLMNDIFGIASLSPSDLFPRQQTRPLLKYWNSAFQTYSNFLERAGFIVDK